MRDDRGQMTVELAVAFPALIIVAVIAVNALTFFADCAAFDRAAHNLTRAIAASPGYSQDTAQSCDLIKMELERTFADRDNLDLSVTHGSAGLDLNRFTARLTYHPTLFGLALRSEIMGVGLPALTHSTQLVVDCYKPGVIL